MILNLFFFQKSLSKNCFSSICFLIIVFEKAQNCRSCRFCGVNGSKSDFLQSKSVSSYKSVSLQNLFRCKTFFFEIIHVLNFSIRTLSSCKKMALCLTRLKFLIQIMLRCTKNDSKTDFFQKVWSNFFFLNENNFFRNNFSKSAQKSQHWRFYGVYWPAKLFFESQFSKNLDFLKITFFIENWCVVNILTQVLTLCEFLIQTFTRSK